MTSAEIAITIIPIIAVCVSYVYALSARRRVLDTRLRRSEDLDDAASGKLLQQFLDRRHREERGFTPAE